MAGRKKGSKSKSAWLRKLLAEKKDRSFADVEGLWKIEGDGSKLTPTLFYQVRSKAGFATKRDGKKRGRKPTAAKTSAKRGVGRPRKTETVRGVARTTDAADPSAAYIHLEKALEGFIGWAAAIGDKQLSESLRHSMRIVGSRLI